jgi:hypothetical protein
MSRQQTCPTGAATATSPRLDPETMHRAKYKSGTRGSPSSFDFPVIHARVCPGLCAGKKGHLAEGVLLCGWAVHGEGAICLGDSFASSATQRYRFPHLVGLAGIRLACVLPRKLRDTVLVRVDMHGTAACEAAVRGLYIAAQRALLSSEATNWVATVHLVAVPWTHQLPDKIGRHCCKAKR